MCFSAFKTLDSHLKRFGTLNDRGLELFYILHYSIFNRNSGFKNHTFIHLNGQVRKLFDDFLATKSENSA